MSTTTTTTPTGFADSTVIVELRGGPDVTLRPVTDTDREPLRAYLEGLGPAARYLRFLQALPEVTDRILDILTTPSPGTLVLVALDGDEIVGEAILGADHRDPGLAHIGYSVAERVRRRGLGRAMVHRLLDVARDRGVRTVRAEMAAGNRASAALLGSVGARMRFEDGLIVAEMDCCHHDLAAA